jgi:hypothetical protein
MIQGRVSDAFLQEQESVDHAVRHKQIFFEKWNEKE